MSRGVSDKITYKPYNQGGQWLLPPSLDELVPQNHFVRIVSKTVPRECKRDVANRIPETGLQNYQYLPLYLGF